ncbi:MAG: 3-isopropylmalate dehydratase large subunit [Burkholderiales bacterium]|nr:MAG: 3-isopropylmalate dehydratase large subunit [Burkholderiales bacterium]
MSGETLFDKIWNAHVVADLGGGHVLLHIDRHLMHDLGGPAGMAGLRERGLRLRNPELTFATPDHAVSTLPGRDADTNPQGGEFLRALRREAAAHGVRLFDLGEPGQGIVHVVGPEQGLSLPGLTIVCGDSHTCTHGGLSALAFGIGSSELLHVLATQTLIQKKPKRMRVSFDGMPGPGVAPKDLVLAMISRLGAAGGSGHAVEYAGAAIRSMGLEGRMTLCNLSIELGAKIGMVAPDDSTFEFVAGRRFAPTGSRWDQALAYWRTLFSEPDAVFDREHTIDVASIAPQVTWGTSPEYGVAVDGLVPDPAAEADAERRGAMTQALEYMGLVPGRPIAGTPIDRVFIGSCTNSRLSDLRAAAAIVRGRKVHPKVRAWVVPGSEQVRRDAEAEGLDRVFLEAGFEWREAGCSMCVAANGETVASGQRCVSTSNRNFVGRQGPGARTHLASPATAAASAIAGCIADVRKLRWA